MEPEKKLQTRTAVRMEAFLAGYRATCNIAKSARLAGIDPRRHYVWLEKCSSYKAAFEAAKPQAAEALEDRVKEGALDGWQEAIFFQGVQCGEVTRFDLGARQMLLRGAMREKYGSKVEVTGKDGAPIESRVEVVFVNPKPAEPTPA